MLIHVVKSGESLWQIASSYRISMQGIIQINQLPNPSRLLIGQSLVIPTEDFIHIVKSGETLWKIAKNYGVSIESIAQANKITNPSSIYPGMSLIIPAPKHIIKSGETLLKIARMYNVSLQVLISANSIKDPNIITPGTVLVIPIRKRPVIDVNGYIITYGEGAVPIIKEVGQHLTYLSPFAYRIKEDGSLEPINDSPAIRTAYSENIVPMMSINNFTTTELGGNLAHLVLSTKEVRERLLTNIINIMKEKNYKGLNVDFENVLPADRELYNNFLQLTVNRLHPLGYFVSSALAPKTSGGQKGLLYEAHDYPAHGRIVDFVVLMTYEWGYRFGPPQAISPLNEIRRVLDYAVSVIPRNKIFMGFQLYARDWVLPHVKGQEAETFSPQDAYLRALKYGSAIQYNTLAASPFYRYRDDKGIIHEVWFEDARSAQAKFNLIKEYNLRGVSYWVLGYPFPQNWALLADNFTIRK